MFTLTLQEFRIFCTFALNLMIYTTVILSQDQLKLYQILVNYIIYITNLHFLDLGGIGHDYPFYYRCPFTILDDGWRAYAIEDKFSKLQLLTGERFRISSVNKDFEVQKIFFQILFKVLRLVLPIPSKLSSQKELAMIIFAYLLHFGVVDVFQF